MPHTQEEWRIATSSLGKEQPFVYAIDKDTGANRFCAPLQRGYTKDGRTSEEELVANAKLMVAAPFLLEALKEIRLIIEDRSRWIEEGNASNLHLIVSAAIAKAE